MRSGIVGQAPSDKNRPESKRNDRDPREQLPLVVRGSSQSRGAYPGKTGRNSEDDEIDYEAQNAHRRFMCRDDSQQLRRDPAISPGNVGKSRRGHLGNLEDRSFVLWHNSSPDS
jgi:hypothetical protein